MTLQPTEFYVAGGTLPPDSPSYIVRAADETLYAGLTAGRFCYVLTSRQMGKSSLMHQTARRLKAEDYAVVTLDLSKIGTNLTLEQWYYGLLRGVGQPLLNDFWEQHTALSPLQRFFAALDEQVLPACPSGMILFVDEIDTVRRLPFSADEFFAAIRERHNAQAERTEAQGITFCLLGVASPGNLITDPRTTPFNIGLRIELTDFTPAEAAPLAAGLGVQVFGHSGIQAFRRSEYPTPEHLNTELLLPRVLYWTGGHPYLTQRLCLNLAEQAQAGAKIDVDRRCAALFFGSRARQEETNLAFVQNTLLQLSDDVAALLELYRRIWRGRHVSDDPPSPHVMLLCLSGLVRPEGGRLVVRNRIYRRVFDSGWVEASMPRAELRRQRAAYRRGAIRVLMASLAALTVVGGLAWNALLNARRADQAARMAAKNAQLYQAERDTARRKTTEAEQAANKAREATKRAEQAAADARAATRRAETAAQQRKAALAQATLARAKERTALSEAQADRGVQELQSGDAAGLLDLADSCRTVGTSSDEWARRAALWYCWYTSCTVELAQIISLEKRINVVRFMPRDGRLVTGSDDGIIRFWNCRTGREEGRTFRPNGRIDLLAVSPDGRYLAASTHDEWPNEARIALWDMHTGRSIPIDIVQAQKALGAQTKERVIFQIVFTPDSKQLAVAAWPNGHPDGVVWMFDTATGAQRDRWLRPGNITDIEFAHHGPLALLHVSGPSGPAAVLIDTRNQRQMGEWLTWLCCMQSDDSRLLFLTGREGAYRLVDTHGVLGFTGNMATDVTRAAFQPGGKYLAIGAADGAVRLYYVPAHGLSRLNQAQGSVVDIRFSPNGSSLAVQSPTAVAVYRLDALNVLQHIVSYEGIEQIEYAPDSAALAVRTGNVVRLWRLHPDNEQVRALGSSSPAQCAVFSPDGRYVATVTADETLRVWETATGRPISPLLRSPGAREGAKKLLGFTPDGARLILVGVDWRLHCWDWRAGRELWQTPTQERDIRALAISPDGRRVATAAGLLDEFCMVRQWDVRTGRPLNWYRERDTANDMAYSPDGTRLLMVGRYHTASIRDAATGAPIGQLLRHDNDIQALAWNRDGRRVVTCSRDEIAQVWDARTGRPLVPPLRHREWVDRVAFSPDDRLIVTACRNGVVQLWDAVTGRPVGVPMDHNGESINQLVFSPDGRLLFTGTMDSTGLSGTVRIWEVPSGRAAGYPIALMDGRYQISVSPNGRWLLGSPIAGRSRVSGDHASDPQALLWRIPKVPNLTPDEIECRTQALLGFRRNAQRFVEAMPPAEWRRLRAAVAASSQSSSFR